MCLGVKNLEGALVQVLVLEKAQSLLDLLHFKQDIDRLVELSRLSIATHSILHESLGLRVWESAHLPLTLTNVGGHKTTSEPRSSDQHVPSLRQEVAIKKAPPTTGHALNRAWRSCPAEPAGRGVDGRLTGRRGWREERPQEQRRSLHR